jgi:hypothetical protein
VLLLVSFYICDNARYKNKKYISGTSLFRTLVIRIAHYPDCLDSSRTLTCLEIYQLSDQVQYIVMAYRT